MQLSTDLGDSSKLYNAWHQSENRDLIPFFSPFAPCKRETNPLITDGILLQEPKTSGGSYVNMFFWWGNAALEHSKTWDCHVQSSHKQITAANGEQR